jgi:foldase protein PrsA
MFAVAAIALVGTRASAQEPLVVVNGEPITREALAHRLIDLSTVGQSQLEEIVNETLLFQAAQKQGLNASDSEIDARIADVKKKLGTEELFTRYLAGQGVTAAGLRDKMRVKILVEKMLSGKAKVTDQEVKQAYEQNKASFERPESLNLRMILTKTKDRADEAIKRLDGGEDFAAVAKALSEHSFTAERGGLLPRAATRENLSPALADAAFATEVGKHTQAIQTPDGYYILKVEARNAATKQSFDQVKEAIRAQLQEMKLQDAWVAWLQEARKQASIERKWQP